MSRDGCIALIHTTEGQTLAYRNAGRWWLAPDREAHPVSPEVIVVSQTCLLVPRRPPLLHADVLAVGA